MYSTARFIPALLFILVTSQTSVHCRTIEPDTNWNFLQTLPAYRLKSTVLLNIDGGTSKYKVEENYDREQGRAVVSYRLESKSDEGEDSPSDNSPDEAGTIFADNKLKFALKYADGSGKCLRSEKRGELMGLLNLDMDYWDLPDRRVKDNLHMGPSQLIDYVLYKRDSFVLKKSNETIRNIPALVFKYSYVTSTKEQLPVTISAYFHEKSINLYHQDAIPAGISISSRTTFIGIEFAALELIDSNVAASIDSDNDLKLDPFILEPLSGCAKVIQGTPAMMDFRKLVSSHSDQLPTTDRGSDNYDPRLDPAAIRYSFKADIHTSGPFIKQPLSFKAFVAADSTAGLMRVDLNESSADIFEFSQVFNFYDRTQYCCIGKSSNNKFMVNHLQKIGREELFGRVDANPGLNTNCIQTKIYELSFQLSKPVQLLFGSEEFVYLGQAKVRGIQAKVYESVESEVPFWLEPTLSLYDSKQGSRHTWSAAKDTAWAYASGQGNKVTTLIYMSDVLFSDNLSTSDGKPPLASVLMIEVLRVDDTYRMLFEKRTINVYDFMWRFEHSTNLGSSLDIFNLGQSTVSTRIPEPFERAKINLLLENESDLTSDNQKAFMDMSAPDRNLALSAAIERQLQVSLSMVSNFQSRFIPSSSSSIKLQNSTESSLTQQKLLVAISFEYNRHVFDEIKLDSLGRGANVLGKTWYFSTLSLVQCAMLTAQMRYDAMFAYDPRQRFCFVGAKKLSQVRIEKQSDNDMPFDMTVTNAPTEVFRLSHARTISASPMIFWQVQDNGHIGDAYRNKKITFENGFSVASFKINKFSLIYINSDSTKFDMNNHNETNDIYQLESISQLNGIGLAPLSGVNEVLKSVPLHSTYIDPLASSDKQHELAEMTAEMCRATCMSDLRCKSYSVCLKYGRLECILSRASFKKHSLVNSIKTAAKESKDESRFSIDLDTNMMQLDEKFQGKRMTLIKNTNCAINNKKYLELFKTDKSKSNSIIKKAVIPVDDIEECAGWCSWYTMRAMQGHYSRMAENLVGLSNSITEEDLRLNPTVMRTIENFKLATTLKNSVCEEFDFIDGRDLEEQPEELYRSLVEYARETIKEQEQHASFVSLNGQLDDTILSRLKPGSQIAHFCAIKDLHNASVTRELGLNSHGKPVPVTKGHFMVLNLYEENYGLSLKASSMSMDEQLAFDLIDTQTKRRLEVQLLDSLLKFVQRGENSQKRVMQVMVNDCAQWCFWYETNLWPGCKSFDIVLERDPWHGNRTTTICQLNTITLNQAITNERTDLIETSTGASPSGRDVIERRHFEPRPGFMLEAATFAADKELMTFLGEQAERIVSHGSLLVPLLIIMTALATGIFMGTKLGEIYFRLSVEGGGHASNSHRWMSMLRSKRANSISTVAVLDLAEQLPPIEEEAKNDDSDSIKAHSININDVIEP